MNETIKQIGCVLAFAGALATASMLASLHRAQNLDVGANLERVNTEMKSWHATAIESGVIHPPIAPTNETAQTGEPAETDG